MGAAGYVTIYPEDAVREEYAKRWPKNSIDEDWWYLRDDSVRVVLDGKRWLVDYSDDQGCHQGVENEFWFKSPEAQERVRRALTEVYRNGLTARTEVWT